MSSLPPGTVMLLGALLLPLLSRRGRQLATVLLPIASLAHLLCFHPPHMTASWTLFDYQLTPIRIDKLSLVWGYVFHIATLLAFVFALHVRDKVEQASAMVYAAASVGAVFAGDLLTLFVYWEVTAVASVFLVWSGRTEHSFAAGMRYAVLHVGSGVLVLAGAVLQLQSSGSLSFGGPNELGMFRDLSTASAVLLLLGFGVKAAFPLLHCWLPDAYPVATASGTVFLSALTTKMAVYALARGFAGCDWLIGIGAVMVVFPLVHAVLADDLRRVLTHVLNNQLGFMVVAVGIGTPLAINGAAAQAFAHVIYKSLLFMALGAVLHRTGSARQTQLSGLARMMPWTCAFCLIGAWSVAPLNCGFVTKSIIVSAALDEHLTVVWLVLLAGGVGAFLTAGMKVPYFTFFGGPASHDVQEAPRHMLAAMGAAAALCLGIGIAPGVFYRLLPNPMEYQPYDVGHVVTQLQTMAFTGCAFVLALRIGWYPRPATGTLLDFDWTYRRAVPALTARIMSWRRRFGGRVQMATRYAEWWGRLTQQCGEGGVLGRSVSTNAMAIAAIILLAVYLFLFYP